MKNVLNYVKTHLPYIIGISLIVVNALVDQGVLTLSDGFTNVINAVLAALGLGVIHHRQTKA